MLGTVSVPHWFRRAISLLNTEVSPQWRVAGSSSRAAARRARARKRVAAPMGYRGGPKVLEEIVTSWEFQQLGKRKEAAAPRRRPRRTW